MPFIPIGPAFGLGTTELLIIVVIIVLLFGARKVPELMRSLGKGVREFKEGMSGIDKEIKEADKKAEKDIERKKSILDTAKKMGIETEGRSIDDIEKEILEKAKEA
ncbi:MAG: twin-arginine translocase TatA/TatE family subunit [Candidatus Bathyarchaeia archaeon]